MDDRAWSRWNELALPGVVLLCMVVTLMRYPLAVNHDDALIMSYAQRLLDGETPYVDFYEINPPLIMYLSTIPVAVGRLLGQNPIPVFNLIVLGFCVWSALSIRRTMIELELPGRALVLTAWLGLAWATQFTLTMGQREHLFVLGYVPFLLLRVARWSEHAIPKRRAIALGVVAGLMVAMKPQFLAVAIVPELYWAFGHRRLRPLASPEVAAAVAIGCAYLLHFAVFPAIGRAYLLELVPQLWTVYATFDDPWSLVADPYRFAWVASAICVAALAQPGPREPAGDTVGGLTAFTIASFVILYLLPQKSWPYHFEPALHGSVLVIAFAVGRVRLVSGSPRWPGALAIGVAAVMFAAATQTTGAAMAVVQRVPKLERAITQHSKPGDTVMMLTCGVPPTWPLLLQIDRRNASRYSGLINDLPRFYPRDQPFAGYRSSTELSREERAFLDTIAEDARRHPPALVVVHRECYGVPPAFDLWTYFDKLGFMGEAFPQFEKIADVEDRGRMGARQAFVVLGRRASR